MTGSCLESNELEQWQSGREKTEKERKTNRESEKGNREMENGETERGLERGWR